MILLSLDFETTGLSPENDRVIEVGSILYSTGQKKCLESSGFLVKTDVPISKEIAELTNIHPAAVTKFGFESKDGLDNVIGMMEMSEAIVGQNVIRFDKKVLEAWAHREGASIPEKLWIDTRTDLPVEGKGLTYQAADHGFLNLFPHSALADCQTVLKLVSMYDINVIVERAKSPTIVLVGKQDRSDNDLAKKRKFRWNPDYKLWWKTIKTLDYEKEVEGCPFPIALAPETVLIEKLWYD